jgi:predicted metal-binding protein
MKISGPATISVCVTCRGAIDAPRTGAVLADATALAAASHPGIRVQRISCLGNCSRGLSAAIRDQRSWIYVFGNLDASRDAAALVTGAALLAQAGDGLMPWRGRPEALKRGMIARIPPADFIEAPP